ncbi:MAG TPA: hypothetical protein VK632_02550, partial [Verrucomicrobiae bacterium]|nr:hypothetical protein [Verrucomicrobiae bacterium]
MTVWSWKSKNRQSDSNETPQVVHITVPKDAGEEHRFAIELRAVGQALEKFKFKGFKLAQQNGVYTVTGQGSDLAATFSLIHFIRDFVHGGRS